MKTEQTQWKEIVAILQRARRTLPMGDEPQPSIYFPYEGEEWKNAAEKAALEDKFWPDTERMICHFIEKQKWPGRFKAAAPFYVLKRIEWALGIIDILLCPLADDLPPVLAPTIEPDSFVFWLLTYAYQGHNCEHKGINIRLISEEI